MAEQLEIVIGANVDDAKAGVKDLQAVITDFARQGKLSIGVIEQSMAQLKQQIKITTDPGELTKLNAAFTQLQQKLTQLKSEGGLETKLGGISRSARLAHTDIDQVARDLQLFASGNERAGDALSSLVFTFERLKGTAGGTKAAFSALGEAFLGPAGIIIALSTAANLLAPFVENLFKASEASKETAENAKKLKDSISGIFEGSAKEATEVLSLIAVLKSETETRERKLEAIKELNKIAPETFNNLKLEGNAVRNLDSDYKQYLESLKTVIAAKIKQAQLEQLVTQLLEKQGVTATGFAKNIQDGNRLLDEQIKKKQAAGQELNSLEALRLEQSRKEQQDIKKLNDQINSLFADLQQLSKGVKLDIKTDTAKQGLTEVQRRLIDIAELAQKVFNVPLKLRFDTGDLDVDKFRKAQEILKGIEDHTIRLNIIVPDKIELPKLKPEIDQPFFKKQLDDFVKGLTAELAVKLQTKSLLEQLDQLKKNLNDAFKFDPKNIQQSLQNVSKLILSDKELQDSLKLSITLDTDPTKFAEEINSIKQFLPKELQSTLDIALEVGDIKTIGLEQSIAKMNKDINKAIDNAIAGISTEGFTTIGQAIGDALSGGDLSNTFKQFGAALGSAVEALGKQIIALGIAAALAKKSLSVLFAQPGLAIIAGITLVAIGEALKNLLSGGLKGFAKGGRPPVGEWVIVGEKGPELFKTDQPGRVYSNRESKSLLSSSVKDHETIKEYLIANRVSQQLKEHFSYAFKSIENTVKTISASHEKLISYSYKLHESVNSLKETNSFYKDTVASISSTIERITEKPIDKSSHYETSFHNINSSVEKLHDKISSHSSVTVERIINNNFFSTDSFKDTFKSMSIMNLQKMFNIPAFAQGGAVFGPTLAILGEGFGVSRSNPEFVGTASQLKGIQGGQFDVNVSVDGELSFSMGKLAVALNREVRSQLRTSGKNPF